MLMRYNRRLSSQSRVRIFICAPWVNPHAYSDLSLPIKLGNVLRTRIEFLDLGWRFNDLAATATLFRLGYDKVF